MKVILLKDVENVGRKYEVKEVKEGFARNFLIPNKLAKPATKQALKWLETQMEIERAKAEEELKKVQELAAKIDGIEIEIPVKVGKDGQLFEKVGVQKIYDKLQEMGFDIKKNQIEIKEPFKELGDFSAKIKFSHNLEAEITVILTEEKNTE